jgi:hypothetical protein
MAYLGKIQGLIKGNNLGNFSSATSNVDYVGTTNIFTAGENLVSGNLCYLKISDNKFYKADNSSESTCSTLLAIATETINTNNTGNFILLGNYITTDLTVGTYYVGSSGSITSTKPSNSGKIVRSVGTAISTTTLIFNPNSIYIELV